MRIFRPYWVPLFFLGISILALFPYLFLDKLILTTDSDALYYYYPAFDFLSRSLKAGESFLWNPHIFSGFPMYLSQSAGFLDPLNWLVFSWLPAIDGYHVRLLIDFVLTMMASYAAARAFGVSRLASLLVGPAYLVSFHWRFLSNLVIANSLFLLPFLFFLYAKIRSSEFRWWSGGALGGLALGWVFIAGYAQLAIYNLVLLGIFVIFDSLWRGRSERPPTLVKHLGFLASVTVVGFLAGLPQILPALKFSAFTIRAGGLEFAATVAKSVGFGDLVLFLFPDYLYFPYISAGRKPLFVGAFWFFMAVSALFLFWKKREVKLFGSLFIFCFAASLAYSPLFYFMHKLPVLEYFRFPFRWMYLGTWFLSILGAFGFDLMREYKATAKAVRMWKFAGYGAAALLLAVILFPYIQSILNEISPWLVQPLPFLGFSKDALHYQDAVFRGLQAWGQVLSFSNFEFIVPFLLLITAIGVILMYLTNKVNQQFFRRAGAGLVLATFLWVFAHTWQTSLPQASLEAHETVLESIPPEDRIMYRTYPFMIVQGFILRVPPKFTLTKDELLALTELQLASGLPNTHSHSGVSSVDGYDPFLSRTYLERLTELGSLHGAEDATRDLTANERINRLYSNLSLLGSMSGKYIISGVELQHPKLVLLQSYDVSHYKIPLYLYRNTEALPRFHLRSNLSEQLDGNIVPARPSTIENGYFAFEVKGSFPQWLTVLESNLPGWEARVDGRVVPILEANGLYMAIEVPAGVHRASFLYRGVSGEERLLEGVGLIRSHKP